MSFAFKLLKDAFASTVEETIQLLPCSWRALWCASLTLFAPSALGISVMQARSLLCVLIRWLYLVCLLLWLIFLLLLQKSSQLEVGTTEQSSQTSKSGGLEHSNELQKVNFGYFSKAAVNSGSSGWDRSFVRLQGRAWIPEHAHVFSAVPLCDDGTQLGASRQGIKKWISFCEVGLRQQNTVQLTSDLQNLLIHYKKYL